MLLLSLPALGQNRPAAVGTGLRGQYYEGKNFEKLVLTRTDKAIDFDWTQSQPFVGQSTERFVSPGPGVPAEWLSARWTRYLYAPESSSYTFQMVIDDGMRVWIGGQKVLDSWTDQAVTRYSARKTLTAGRYYSLRVEYYQVRWVTRALLSWQLPSSQAPSAPEQDVNFDLNVPEPPPIPSQYLYPTLPAAVKLLGPPAPKSEGTRSIMPDPPPGKEQRALLSATPVQLSAGVPVRGKVPAGSGLQATYYAGSVRGPAVHSRVEPVVNVTWRGPAPAPGVPGQGFSVRWTGYVYAPESGLYVLHTEWDDATDIRFAGESVLSMEQYEPEYFLPRKPPIPVDMARQLTAGQFYRINLTCKNVRGVSRAVLSWTRPSTAGTPTTLEQAFAGAKRRGLAVVPQQFLYPELPRPLPEPPATPVWVARTPAKPPARPRPPVAATTRPKPTAPRPVRPAPGSPSPVGPVITLPDLAALSRGSAVTLPNLYFTQSTAFLISTSRPTLNALARTLRAQPNLRLEIAGHTDNVREAALNQRLSEQRAQVIRRYLVQQGIDAVRLLARGYGGTRPVVDNRSARNRRVEAIVQ